MRGKIFGLKESMSKDTVKLESQGTSSQMTSLVDLVPNTMTKQRGSRTVLSKRHQGQKPFTTHLRLHIVTNPSLRPVGSSDETSFLWK